MGVRATWVYSLLAFIVWIDGLGSGVHAAIAGVVVAMVIPVRPAIDPGDFLDKAGSLLGTARGKDNSLDALIHDAERRSSLEQLALTVEDAMPQLLGAGFLSGIGFTV